MFTPERISKLEPNQIFVFGSNLHGQHAGGAARVAFDKFGAIWGQGVGMQGQCYAIPTMQGGVETIKPYVDEFIEFAKAHTEYTFLVTRIGCGIAGFKDSEIAPLFDEALGCENITLPKEFVEVLEKNMTQRRCDTVKNSDGKPLVTEKEFAARVSRKIKGWYKTEAYHNKAVERIVRQRDEIVGLLESVEKYNTKKLIAYLDKSGFFYRPSGANRHHNFPGGLAEHSLGTYRIVEEWNRLTPVKRHLAVPFGNFIKDKHVRCDIFTEKMDHDDMIVAAICHDLCKAEHYYFDGRRIRSHQSDIEPKRAHASLSVKRLKACGIDGQGSEEMMQAVMMHMHLYSKPRSERFEVEQDKARGSMLAIAVWAADKLDASRHPAARR